MQHWKVTDLYRRKVTSGRKNHCIGFIQRGGNSSAYDRILASKMGISAVKRLAKDEWSYGWDQK